MSVISQFGFPFEDLKRRPYPKSNGLTLPYHTPPTTCQINKVSREILSMIFRECTRTSPVFNGFLPGHYEAPLVLGWVCQSWRKIAFSDPMLWTRISNHTGLQDFSETSQVYEDWIKLNLQNSDDKGLALFLGIKNEAKFRYISSTSTLELCMSAISRWDHLDIELDFGTAYMLFSTNPEEASMLSSVVIRHNGAFQFMGDVVPSLFAWVLSLPRVSHLVWNVPGTIDPEAVMWGKLTHLKMGTRLDMIYGADLLTRCTHLTHLELTLIPEGTLNHTYTQIPVNHFPSLQVFKLKCTPEAYRVLLSIKAPNLRSFQLVIEQYGPASGLQSFEIITQFLAPCDHMKNLRVYECAKGLELPSVNEMGAIIASWFLKGYETLVLELKPDDHDYSHWQGLGELISSLLDPENKVRFSDPEVGQYSGSLPQAGSRTFGFGWGISDPVGAREQDVIEDMFGPTVFSKVQRREE